MSPSIDIGGRLVGPGNPCLMVAELSGNHKGEFRRAKALIREAAEAGAGAVKIQTYTADTITLDCDTGPFRIEGHGLWGGRTLYDLYKEAYTPWEWQPELKAYAESHGLLLFSSPFDPSAVAFLEEMDVPAYKVASFEITDAPLLQCVARTGKPVILSTGMATIEEIEEAVQTLQEAGATGIVLLKCTSAYPAPLDEMNLRGIPALAERFGAPVGLSDHSLGTVAPVAAVTLGACLIEKHLTLDRGDGGPDAAFSLEPAEFARMVRAVRDTERALGSAGFDGASGEEAMRKLRRSLFVVEDIRAGQPFTAENVRSIRPAAGLHPRHLSQVLGRRAACDITRGTPLSWEHVEPA
jgi:pseudaminic acid synthase